LPEPPYLIIEYYTKFLVRKAIPDDD